MIRSSMECAIDLLMEQYQNMTNHDSRWELNYLCEEANKGMDTFSDACRIVFGIRLSAVLYRAIAQAQAMNNQACDLADPNQEQEEEIKIAMISTARDLSAAAKILHDVQHRQHCDHLSESFALSQRVEHDADTLQRRIDPDDSLDWMVDA